MIRVMVVDDSLICSELLTDQLEADGDIEVVETASSGHEALDRLAAADPDVVTVDLNMPGMDGLTLIETIMSRDPRPIIVVTGLDARERDLAVAATERGALELVNKAAADDEESSRAIRTSVRRLASVAVEKVEARAPAVDEKSDWPAPRPGDASTLPILAFGSSAGGPKALFDILARLPRELPAAIAVTHHLPPDFVSAFSRLLVSRASFSVRVVQQPVKPERGVLVLAPGGNDLVYRDGMFQAVRPQPGAVATPRVDVLFESLAAAAGAHVGVVLSGLGDDGSRGLASMRQAGKMTIAQHRATATVWGMPRAAMASAVEVLNTHEIDGVISRWLSERGPRG